MKRSAVVLGSAIAIAAASTGAALAQPSDTGVLQSQHRVCALPPAGFAACDSHIVTNATTGKPLATTSYANGYNPDQLRTAYQVPASGSAPTVAIVDAYANPNATSDLDIYRQRFGLGTANLQQINQDGGSISAVSGNTSWGQEEMLDLEMVSAICPACPILYVGANSASFTDLSTAVTTAASKGAKVISNSYGGNEFRGEDKVQGPYNQKGIAVTVSSGDSGYGAQFPATAAYAIAVGGTSLKLSSTSQRVSETVWSGAGSGCSAYIAKPSWQTSACSRRMEADIAAVADPSTGVAVYDSYGSTGGANWYVFGGTSVAAPLVGAIYAVYNVPVGTSGYAAENAWTVSGLYDVTSGSNGHCTKGRTASPAYFCTGSVGYDGPSGNGTPNGQAGPF